MELDASKLDAMETEEKHAPTASGRVFAAPRRVQFTILFIIAGGVLGIWWIGPFRAAKEQTSSDSAASSEATGFKLTPQQWATMKITTVEEMVFQPACQAEGKIAIDDHHATWVYPPYNGRVTAVLVRDGDYVKQGQPLFRMDSTDLVQAQNDVVAGNAGVAKAQSQLTLAQTAEERAHQLYLAKAGAVKDWQQAQANLTATQNYLKSAQIALAAAQDRLRIILVQSGETAVLSRTSPDLTVPSPINGQVRLQAGRWAISRPGGDRSGPGDRRSFDGQARGKCARDRCAFYACRPAGRSACRRLSRQSL